MKCFGAWLVSLLLLISLRLSGQDEPRQHVVKSLENYYSLSLKYDIPIEELKRANPEIASPKPGDVLLIPLARIIETDVVTKESDYDIRVLHDELFRVALMIPFNLEEADDTLWSAQLDPSRIGEVAPFRFIQFYHGFMMAADSLRKQGLDVIIHVYDVSQQTYKVEQALNDPAMKNMDLIVGPFYRNGFAQAADFARRHEIPIVNPFSTRDDILTGNPFVFKVLPAPEDQVEIVTRLVTHEFSDHRVIIYTANSLQGAGMVAALMNKIEAEPRISKVPVAVVDFVSDSTQGFLDFALRDQPNLVIAYSENESLPAALMGKLNAWRHEYPVSIIGLPEWDRFNNLESPYLMSLNTHVLAAAYFDPEYPENAEFIRRYRATYYDEPQNYAFSGFDVGYFFLGALGKYGKGFMDQVYKLEIKLLQTDFHFYRPNEDDGFENTSWKVLKYNDFRLIEITMPDD